MGFDKWRASTRHSELWNSWSLSKPLVKWRNAIWPNNNHYNYIQPLDISVNRSDKNFLQHHVHEWYTQQTCQQLKGMVPQDLKLSIKSPKFLAKSSNYKILCEILINSHVIYEPWKLTSVSEAFKLLCICNYCTPDGCHTQTGACGVNSPLPGHPLPGPPLPLPPRPPRYAKFTLSCFSPYCCREYAFVYSI